MYAIQATGVYPWNPESVLDVIMQKEKSRKKRTAVFTPCRMATPRAVEEACKVLGDATSPMTERARVGRQMLEMADTPSKIIDNAQFAGKTQSSIFENITKSGYRKPRLGGPDPERRQLSFRGQEVTTLRELETKQAEQAESKRRKLLPTIYDPQKAPGGSILSL